MSPGCSGPKGKPEKSLMFKAYLDDSGTHGSSSVAVVAGYISTAIRWQSFNKEWRRLLHKERVRFVHMADLESLRGQFSPEQGWTKERREAFLRRSSKIIVSRARGVVGSAVSIADWKKTMPQDLKKEFGGAYGWCAHECVVAWHQWRKEFAPNQRCQFVFETGTEGRGQVDRRMNELVKSHQEFYGVVGYGFNDKTLLPLHAADMIAYEIYREAENHYVKGDRVPVRYSLALLMEGLDKRYVTYWNEERMIDWIKRVRETDASK
jgi:hypothetical protein